MEVSDQLHFPSVLPPGNVSPVMLLYRPSGTQSQSGRGGEEKIVPLAGIETWLFRS
jgi:hypothetical protein